MATGSRSREGTDADPLPRRAVLGLIGAATVARMAIPAGARPDTETGAVEVAPYSVVNVAGELPLDPGATFEPDTPLYDWYELPDMVAIEAPDGHHVTWGEFSDVGGSVKLTCLGEGTQVAVHADGLLPKGLYTVWVAVLDPDTLFPVGAAPLGPNDGDESDFRASRSGRGRIVGIDRGGGLTADVAPGYEGFRTPDCLFDLTGEYVVEIAMAYHYDDRVHGPEPRPNAVEQTSTLFEPRPLSPNQAGQSVDPATPGGMR